MTLAFAPERIETWPLSRLQPYAKNAKQHGANQFAKIAARMAEFGWTVPCLVAEDGELIAGQPDVYCRTQGVAHHAVRLLRQIVGRHEIIGRGEIERRNFGLADKLDQFKGRLPTQ